MVRIQRQHGLWTLLSRCIAELQEDSLTNPIDLGLYSDNRFRAHLGATPLQKARSNEFFLPGNPRSITEKWKQVPKDLLSAGFIAGIQDLRPNMGELRQTGSIPAWATARSSQSSADSWTSGQSMPVPTMGELHGLPPGWCVPAISTLVHELNAAAGTPAPSWLT